MINDELTEKLKQLFKHDLEKAELKEKLQSLLGAQLQKMDLVSREEFEAQSAVLLRTREKLENLEKQFAELETYKKS